MKKSKSYTSSTLRALDVLEYLASYGYTAGVTEISRKLSLDKSTTYRILSTLEHRGYIMQDKVTKKYYLGFKLLELSHKASSRMELKKVARQVLDKLVKKCNETAHIGILDKGEILYLDTQECPQFMRVVSHIGLRNPVHCTALGKAILAFLPEEQVEQICKDKGMKRFTERTITDLSRLKEELKKIRKRGYAVDNQELYEGTRCIAAPIRNHEGKVIAALSISAPVTRLSLNKVKKLSKEVMSSAKEISESLGYQGNLP